MRRLAEALQRLRAGRFDEAVALCEQVLAEHPGNPDALHMRGALALQLGDLDTALGRLEAAVATHPDNPGALSDLGLALHRARRVDEAVARLNRALELNPRFPEAMLNLANALTDKGDDVPALTLYRQALALRPQFPEALNGLALSYLKLGLAEDAVAVARQAVKLRPAFTEAHLTLGRALNTLGRFEDAVAAHREALRLAPALAEAHQQLANSLRSFGHLQEAAQACRRAIALQPERGEWHRLLAQVTRFEVGSADLGRMQSLWSRPDLPKVDRMHLGFALGKALEDIGDYAGAFACFREGNAIKRASFAYSREDTAGSFADIRQSFTPEVFERLAGSGAQDATPIFVVGMPRTGTTLVEQVLASHPEVFGAGEHTLLNGIVGGLGPGPGPFRFGPIVAGLTAERLAALGEAYVRSVRRLSPEARFIVDKLPGNFMLIGMIRLTLPRAKVIFCRRDPVETGLSIYKNYFANQGLRYAYDLGDIGHYLRLHDELMSHWQSTLPGFVHEVAYEAVVADLEEQTRRVLAFCGLDWRDECLDFHRTARPVHTASAAQVREPVYGSSVRRAQHYGDALRPLREALQGGG